MRLGSHRDLATGATVNDAPARGPEASSVLKYGLPLWHGRDCNIVSWRLFLSEAEALNSP